MSEALATLRTVLGARAEALAAEAGLAEDAAAFDAGRFEPTFAAVGRRLGTAAIGGDVALSDASGTRWSIAAWGCDEVGRAFLLVAASARVPASEQAAWVESLYRTGALRERTAVLRALSLLPDPSRFLPVALDACRTSTQPIFEAIACANPYPAAHFPDASFAQLVMKAVFTGVPLARILGLVSRRTPELARMARDYADERRAAGRDVPADLDLLTSDA